MRNIIWLLLFCFALLLSFYYFREYNKAAKELQEAKKQLSETEDKLRNQYRLTEELVQRRDSADRQLPNMAGATSEAKKDLNAMGFQNPERELLRSLQQQPGLVPRTGTMGGNMTYRSLTLLTNQFAIAYFEDGHNGGYALLRYKAKSPSDIKWKLLDNHDL